MSPTPTKFKIEPAVVWKRFRNRVIVLGVLALLVVTLPLSLPFVAITRRRHAGRIRRAALAFVCPGCGQALGDASLELARQRWQADLADYARRNPGLKFNFHCPYDAVCPRCEIRYGYRLNPPSAPPSPGAFVPVSASI